MTRPETGISADERLRRLQWQALALHHDLALLGEVYWNSGRSACWVIGKPGTNVFRTEILAGIFGSLIVHGDFELVRFGHYGDHADAFSRLCWMGCCTDVGYYVSQKARIGSGRSTATEEYDEDVARHELLDHIADLERGGAEDKEIAFYREALAHVGDVDELQQYLYENGWPWDAHEHRFGRVTSAHIITAHVALNKLVSLLFERHGPDGPPECRATP